MARLKRNDNIAPYYSVSDHRFQVIIIDLIIIIDCFDFTTR